MIFHIYKTLLLGLLVAGSGNLMLAQTSGGNYQLSRELLDQEKFTEALQVINRVLAEDSSRAEYILVRANCYFGLGQYEKTINDCYTILRMEPNMAEVYMLRGKVCNITQSYGGAILFFGKAIQYSSENSLLFEAFFNRGLAYFELGKFVDARASFEAAYDIDPMQSKLLLALAETYLKLYETAKATEMAMEVVENEPENPGAYAILGKIASQKKDFPQAKIAFERYAELQPSPDAYNQLAQVYFETDEYTEALGILNKSIALDPKNPVPYKLKGIIYVEQGSKEVGCDHLFQALQLGYLEKYGYDLLDIYLKLCEKAE